MSLLLNVILFLVVWLLCGAVSLICMGLLSEEDDIEQEEILLAIAFSGPLTWVMLIVILIFGGLSHLLVDKEWHHGLVKLARCYYNIGHNRREK